MKRSKVYLTRRQSRLVDELAIQEGISGVALMENAGKACVSRLTDRDIQSAVICCGVGNNGGDGFVIARRLAILGLPVKTILCGDPTRVKGDALINLKIAESLDLEIINFENTWTAEQLSSQLANVQGVKTDWIVDCLLGTGATGNPRPPSDQVVNAANEIDARKMAVDVPSGLDCDTGEAGNPTFKADLTCTLVAKKIGFQSDSAAKFLGEVQVLSIGVSLAILDRILKTEG